MLFSSLLFVFLFLPLIIPIILVPSTRIQNYLLLIASIIFYAWGGVRYTSILLVSIVLNYAIGLLIPYANRKHGRLFLIIGIIINLGLLCVFKYLNFITDSFNHLLPASKQFSIAHIALPVGISFFTFHGLSYIIDVYRGKTQPLKDFGILALYIALFPQLIAGPIIRYKDISQQFFKRTISVYKFSYGIKRFIIGLAKKVLIANTFAFIADEIFNIGSKELSPAVAWLGIISYTIQIYFDFSGYSDMAVGLGRMLGFRFPENFNLPYIAQSIQEFWRRWHISLSTWFRDYLYIPLGGNKVSTPKVFRNLLIVFFLCGLWHGASMNFIVWGLYHGFFLGLERTKWSNIVQRFWKPFRHFYTMMVVMVGWIFFRSDTLNYSIKFLFKMFTFKGDWGLTQLISYVNNERILCLVVAIIFATRLPKTLYIYYRRLAAQNSINLSIANSFQRIISVSSISFLFILSLLYIASSSYNPFIYFRF